MNAEAMSSLEVWLIIALVIGVILSNLAVLKYSAKFKMPQFGDPKKSTNDKPPPQDSAEETDGNAQPKDASAPPGQNDKSSGQISDKQK